MFCGRGLQFVGYGVLIVGSFALAFPSSHSPSFHPCIRKYRGLS